MKSNILSSSSLTGMPAFSIIWIGQLVSLVGSSMTQFAIGIWLYQKTGLATTFTTMVFFTHIPRILLSPFAGALVDRWNRKFVMMISDLATGLTTILIYFLVRGGLLEIWHVYLLAALSSAFESFQFPAYSSAITMMVDKKHFARASAMLSLADQGSNVLAPILAAALIGIIQLRGIVLIDILTFITAIGTLLIVPVPQPIQSKTGMKVRQGLLQEAGDGFRFMLENPGLLGIQANFLMVNLMSGMSTILRTPMVLARTGNNEFILGIVSSVMAGGGLVGGLAMSIWGGPKRRIHAVLGGLILMNLSRAILGLGRGVIVWSLGGFLIMLFVSLTNSTNQAFWQTKTPADIQGRVFATRRLTGQLTFPLAVLVAGPLSDRWFEPAMAAHGTLAPIFGGLVGTGPGTGMSLMILLAAVTGIFLPVLSYTLPAIRNLENILPNIDGLSTDAGAHAETAHDDPGKQKQTLPA